MNLAPLAIAAFLAQAGPRPFELAEEERVVLAGNAFVERDLQHNHFEAFLTARFHGKNAAFRNLGWSGDTVWGHARAGFGSPQDGFNHLVRHVEELKPTVLFLAYGMNESFEGEKGLDGFRKGLERLLEAVGKSQARIILLSPVRHEDLGPPFPDASEHNRNLRLYADAIKAAAAKRGLAFVDLLERMGTGTKEKPLTDNGIHLNDLGYRRAAAATGEALGLPPRRWRVEIEASGQVRAEGTAVTGLEASASWARFKALDEALPVLEAAPRILAVRGLAAARYALRVGAAAVASGSAEEWARGVELARGPEFDQAAELRRTIEAKNFQYFNRWRPQNETYIFGFRKKEQGHLAPEIPQFDPIVAQKETEIAKLRAPAPQTYVLEREK
jgi:lysophospholipase L1-like esterase